MKDSILFYVDQCVKATIDLPLVNELFSQPIPNQESSSMSTLAEYRVLLGWSKAMLAKEAGVSPQFILKAEDGGPITARSATKIAQALSRGFEKVIMAQHIEGLNVQEER